MKMFKKIGGIALAFMMILGCAACATTGPSGGDETDPPIGGNPEPAVPTVAFESETLTMDEWDTVTLKVTASDGAGVTLTVGTPKILYLKGAKITAVGAGETTVTANTATGATATLKVTVTAKPEARPALTLSGYDEVAVDTIEEYTATFANVIEAYTVTFDTSDHEIATINEKGELTALKEGNVKVTAKTTYYGVEFTDEIDVTVATEISRPVTKREIFQNGTRLATDANGEYHVNTTLPADENGLRWLTFDTARVDITKTEYLRFKVNFSDFVDVSSAFVASGTYADTYRCNLAWSYGAINAFWDNTYEDGGVGGAYYYDGVGGRLYLNIYSATGATKLVNAMKIDGASNVLGDYYTLQTNTDYIFEFQFAAMASVTAGGADGVCFAGFDHAAIKDVEWAENMIISNDSPDIIRPDESGEYRVNTDKFPADPNGLRWLYFDATNKPENANYLRFTVNFDSFVTGLKAGTVLAGGDQYDYSFGYYYSGVYGFLDNDVDGQARGGALQSGTLTNMYFNIYSADGTKLLDAMNCNDWSSYIEPLALHTDYIFEFNYGAVSDFCIAGFDDALIKNITWSTTVMSEGGGEEPEPPIVVDPVIPTVAFEQETLTMDEWGTVTLNVTASDGAAITLTVGNTEILYLDGTKITAVGAGETTVTANTATGATATLQVTVTAKPDARPTLTLSGYDEANVGYKGVYTATFTGIPNGTVYTVTFETSDSEIATIDRDGILTALKEGTVTVTAKTTYCGVEFTGELNLNISAKVEPPPAPTVEFENETITMDEWDTVTLTVTASDGANITLTVGNTNILYLDGMKITAVGAGETTVTATSATGATATLQVTVTAKPEVRPELTLSGYDEVTVDSTEVYTATFVNVTEECTVTFDTTDHEIATVNEDGELTALKEGTVKLTAKTTYYGVEFTAEMDVEVVTELTHKREIFQNGTRLVADDNGEYHVNTALPADENGLRWLTFDTARVDITKTEYLRFQVNFSEFVDVSAAFVTSGTETNDYRCNFAWSYGNVNAFWDNAHEGGGMGGAFYYAGEPAPMYFNIYTADRSEKLMNGMTRNGLSLPCTLELGKDYIFEFHIAAMNGFRIAGFDGAALKGVEWAEEMIISNDNPNTIRPDKNGEFRVDKEAVTPDGNGARWLYFDTTDKAENEHYLRFTVNFSAFAPHKSSEIYTGYSYQFNFAYYYSGIYGVWDNDYNNGQAYGFAVEAMTQNFVKMNFNIYSADGTKILGAMECAGWSSNSPENGGWGYIDSLAENTDYIFEFNYDFASDFSIAFFDDAVIKNIEWSDTTLH